MATLQQTTYEQVLKDPRARDRNVPNSERTYFEMLSDPDVGNLIKNDVVDQFIKTFVKPPSNFDGQTIGPITEEDPRFVPPEAPAGGLLPGETVDSEGTLSYDPALEARQRQSITLNIGSIVDGKMAQDGTFVPGPPRPGSSSVTFNLPMGMAPENITQRVWDHMLGVIRNDYNKEYHSVKQLDSVPTTAAKAVAREALLGVPSIVDMPGLILRGLDYVFSPVGTNTLARDILSWTGFGRPEPYSPYMETRQPRIGQALGLYSTEYPNALYEGAVVIDPSREIMPVHSATGKLLDEVLVNLGQPGLLTPQQVTEAQRNAEFFGGIFGGSLSVSGAARLGAKAFTKGLKLEDLQDATTLNRFLYSVANSPGAEFAIGRKTRRRYTIPGTMVFMGKDLALSGIAGGAMHVTPDEWGPTGKIMAGLTAPFALSRAKAAVTALTRGRGVPIIGDLLEPFSSEGQQRLAARYLASIPGIKGNERLITQLLIGLENVPTRAGQDTLVSTPAYFGNVSDELGEAAQAWTNLRGQGVSDADAIAQLSQNAVYGKYLNGEVPVFGDRPPSVESLAEVGTALRLVSDNMFGAMSWLETGSPIKNEVLRSAGDRLKVAEQVFKNLARQFDADPAAASAHVERSVARLDELVDDALATHATDAILYTQLKDMISDPAALSRARITNAERAVEGIQNAFREAREIETALWTNIGANQIEISPQNMALIGDKAAEIILSTPVAQRNQIPSILYQVAGKNRLLSDEALDSMAKAAGAVPETPAAIRNARAKIVELETRQAEIESRPYQNPALAKAQRKLSQLEAELNEMGFNTSQARIDTKQTQIAGQEQRIADLSRDTVDPRLIKINEDITAQRARLRSLEEDLVPTTTTGDETIKMGPNGILDNVNTLDEVLATRTALLNEAARAASRTGGKNSARIANDAQTYIIDDWLQNPEIFGDAGTTAAYDAARKFSADLNTRFTRGYVADYLATAADRGAKVDHNQILAKIIQQNQTTPGRIPSGSLDELDAALVQARAPFIKVNEDGSFFVDPDAALTPGLEGLTWRNIRTGGTGSEKLSAELLRQEILNQLALIGFDSTGVINPQKIQKAIRTWALPIERVQESYPNFAKELQRLSTSGEELATRHAMLQNPTRESIDKALATQNLDDLRAVKEAGNIVRKIQADRSSASVFLDNKDPGVVVAQLLTDPKNFETNVAATLKILDADETGAARAGFQRAFFDELMKKTLANPESAGRMASESVLDPSQINQVLVQNETALRQVFSDFVGRSSDGQPLTGYDMLKTFNDEMLLGMSERAGTSAGAAAREVSLPLRGSELIRNLGRIAGVYIASKTGGPSLVMAGAGGRLAGKVYETGGQDAILKLVSDALVDPSLAKLLLTETATLSKKGKFIIDKRISQAVAPYQFMAGPPSQVIREAAEDKKARDRIKREGGPFKLEYDPDMNIYRRQKVGDRSAVEPVATPQRRLAQNRPAPRSPSAASTLSQVSPVGPPPMAQGPVSPVTLARGQQIFGSNDPIFTAAHGGYADKNSGIMSIKCKPQQIVG
jgi:hypothetical protein